MTIAEVAERPRIRPKFWSVKRIAERWCCSKSKVYQLIYSQDGEPPRLPSVKFESMVRVRDEDLQEFERCNTTRSTGSGAIAASGSPSTAAAARASAGSRFQQTLAKQAKQRQSAKSAR